MKYVNIMEYQNNKFVRISNASGATAFLITDKQRLNTALI